MKQVFLLAALFFSVELMAQSSVVVHKDPRIDVLLKKQAEVNNVSTRNSAKRRYAPGYRVMVASTSNRNEAIAARTRVLTMFPELKAYMHHQSPYFKITAGNFITRSEAQAYQKRMSPHFPEGVVVINATVEVKPEDVEGRE